MGEAYIVRRGGGGTGSMSKPPEYTYTGVSEFIDEGDGINWWMKLKTSGVLTFTKLNNAKAGIEVFLVGGGAGGGAGNGSGSAPAGGGGGGYVLSGEFTLEQGISYQAIIGTGGIAGAGGGKTSIFGLSVNGGGVVPRTGPGGDGGSGGGGGGWHGTAAARGGTDGGNGNNASHAGGAGGGVSTIPWDNESTYGRYAGGGGGGNNGKGTAIGSEAGGAGGAGGGGAGAGSNTSWLPSDGAVNTGGGGGGSRGTTNASGKGGSGIILIRNKRA